jgi:hypothetical protein
LLQPFYNGSAKTARRLRNMLLRPSIKLLLVSNTWFILSSLSRPSDSSAIYFTPSVTNSILLPIRINRNLVAHFSGVLCPSYQMHCNFNFNGRSLVGIKDTPYASDQKQVQQRKSMNKIQINKAFVFFEGVSDCKEVLVAVITRIEKGWSQVRRLFQRHPFARTELSI